MPKIINISQGLIGAGSKISAVAAAAPWVPTDEPGLEWWYQAKDGPNNPIDGGIQTSWADKSGNGRDQTTQAGTPVYRSTLGPNSGPCVEFDGVTEWMQSAGWIVLDTAGVHVFFVFNQPTWTNGDGFYCKDGVGLSGLFYQANGANNVRMFSGSVGPQTTGVLPAVNTWYHSEQLWFGANSTLVIQAATFGPATPGTTTFDGLVLGSRSGGANPGNVRIAECFAYSHELTGAVLANARAYINSEHGLTTL